MQNLHLRQNMLNDIRGQCKAHFDKIGEREEVLYDAGAGFDF